MAPEPSSFAAAVVDRLTTKDGVMIIWGELKIHPLGHIIMQQTVKQNICMNNIVAAAATMLLSGQLLYRYSDE